MPVSDLDPYSAENILDPYPLHEALRELGPIAWLSRYNTCVATRYQAVNTVLMTASDFLSSGGVGMSDIRKPGAWRVAPTSISTCGASARIWHRSSHSSTNCTCSNCSTTTRSP